MAKITFLVLVIIQHLVSNTLGFSPAYPKRCLSRKSSQFSSLQEQSSATDTQCCKIQRVEKFARLPVWPAWNGAFLFLVSRVLGDAFAARLENSITGRVCPNFFQYEETSPFIMLVHHCHTFCAIDPLRFFQRTFFPEGFPAHPHRGFVTLTYILHGGFVHRDSKGVRQTYGQEEAEYEGKHSQWLNTGAGILHEEMFNIRGFLSRQELYQLWINLPASNKLETPTTTLLGGKDSTPIVETQKGERTIVLAGPYQDQMAEAPIVTPMTILHVMLDPGAEWRYEMPQNYETVTLYLRQGTLTNGDGTGIATHHTAFIDASAKKIKVSAGNEGADFLLLAGEPIREPSAAQGSMVMNNAREIDEAYRDYQTGKFGVPWDHRLSDQEWKQHVSEKPSLY